MACCDAGGSVEFCACAAVMRVAARIRWRLRLRIVNYSVPAGYRTCYVAVSVWRGSTTLILRGYLSVIDNKSFYRTFRWMEFESKLFLQGCEDGRSGVRLCTGVVLK